MRDQQYNHLISSTPMKLLTTIAAVLISISAYSQDLIEYDNGTFTQNGEQLSMEQIDGLTLLHTAGRGKFRRGNSFDRMHKNGNLRFTNNSVYFMGGVTTGLAGYTGVAIGALIGVDFPGAAIAFGVPGAGLCTVSYKAFSSIASSPEGCLRKRDKQFNKVADKLNEAIVRAGPTVQSSNQ